MKKSRIAHKCNLRSGFTIAQLVKGFKSSQPRHLVVELEDVKPEVMTFKASMPIQISGIGRMVPKASKFVPVTPLCEVKSVTKKEAKELRRQGYRVRLLGPEAGFSSTTSIIKAIRGATTITGTGKLTLFDSLDRRTGIARRRGGAAYSSRGGGGGGSGFGGTGFGGGGFSFGGGGSGTVTPASERRFLALILIDIEKQKEILEKQASEIRTRMRQLPEDDDTQEVTEEPVKKSIFNEYINEDYMADALFEVYEQYRSQNLFCRDFKPIDLITYMFVMIVVFGYGRMDFRSNGQKPFFDFFKRKVVPNVDSIRGNTRESMGNRLRGKMKYLFPNSTPKNQLPISKRLEAEKAENEFIDVCGNFHKTKYGTVLKRHFGK